MHKVVPSLVLTLDSLDAHIEGIDQQISSFVTQTQFAHDNAVAAKTTTDPTVRDAATTTGITRTKTDAQKHADAAYVLAGIKPSDAEVKSWITTSINSKNTIILATNPSDSRSAEQ